MDIQIEKGVPLEKGGNRKYPFQDMEIGDSFFIIERPSTVQTCASQYGSRNKKKFVTKVMNGGVRVWRVA